MNFETKVVIGAVALVTAFALGRYSVPAVVTKTTENITSEDTKKVGEDKHIKTVTTIVELPSGEKRTETVTTDESTINTVERNVKTESKTSESTSVRSKYSVSALVGTSTSALSPVYGVHASKELIGPIQLGVWGTTDGKVGLSVGLSF